MNVWKMIPHHTDRDAATSWIRKNGRFAIGWGLVGDITDFHSTAQIKEAIVKTYPVPPYKKNSHLGAPSLWSFCYQLQKEDLVVVKGGSLGSLVVKVVGDYEYVTGKSPLFGDYQNQRRVEVTRLDPERIFDLAGGAPGTNVYQTLVKCARSLNENQL